jgi:hypothetical protein
MFRPTKETSDVTDQEKQKAEELISRLGTLGRPDVSVATAATPRLIASMIQTLNGLRSLLGLVRPHWTQGSAVSDRSARHVT